MKILMPDEAEKMNIITQKELKSVVKVLSDDVDQKSIPSRTDLSRIKSVLPKLQKSLDKMK